MPDLITFAKGVNSGYVPVGGVIISDEISSTFDERVFPGGLTYSGHPLAAASIIGSIDAMEDEGIVENARAASATRRSAPGSRTSSRSTRSSARSAARASSGRSSWSRTGGRGSPCAAAVIGQLKKELTARGLVPFAADNRIHVVPPCVVTDDEVAQAMSIYDEALTVVEELASIERPIGRAESAT